MENQPVKSFPLPLNETDGKRPMHGRDLALRVKKTSPAQRAALAAWVARGEVSITALTTAQTALLMDLNVSSVSLAKSATDEDLAALRRGVMSLRDLRAKRSAERIREHAERIKAALNALIDIGALTPTQAAAE
jgi:hypothetical protein